MENILLGLILKLEFLKVQYWDHYFFWITNPKLFADDTSLFSIVHDPNATANDLNNDLAKINDWASNGKWILILTLVKKLRRFFFSRKIKSQNHPCLHFNNNPVNQTPLQKHLGMYLDPKLDFLEHLKTFRPKWTNQLLY